MARSNGNPQVLMMKKIIRAFCRFSRAHKAAGYALSPKGRRDFTFENGFNGRSCSALPMYVPKEHFAVYVDSGRSRFIIPTDYLNDSLFRSLLEKLRKSMRSITKWDLPSPVTKLLSKIWHPC